MATPVEGMRELLDLTAVHAFYKLLLENHLGHPVPVPMEKPPLPNDDPVGHSTAILKRWLRVLDMAIAPPMVRDGLGELSGNETAEALLRYYVLKSSGADVDRDKTDFVVTWLYRNPIPSSTRGNKQSHAGQGDPYFFFAQQANDFKKELLLILGDLPIPEVPEEHIQLLREFEFIYHEVDDLRTFDQLMDSGVMQKVREIKHSFAKSFYHPDVLSLVAAYNVFFGSRFDELFREATRQIKTFAAKVQQEGGSIMSRVDGDVIVKHLTEVDEGKVLKQEYGRAQEQFRRVSKFKKAVDSRRSSRGPAALPINGTPIRGVPIPSFAQAPAPAPAPATAAPRLASLEPLADQVADRGDVATQLEEGKAHGMQESIRNFVRAADPKAAAVVPLRHGNVTLTAAEIDAFRADYQGEKSFRSDYAATLMFLVALQARMMTELEEFRGKQNSAYLWKPHADSLTHLLTFAGRAIEDAAPVLATAEQRGLTDKVNGLNGTIQKLRSLSTQVAKALQTLGAPPPTRNW